MGWAELVTIEIFKYDISVAHLLTCRFFLSMGFKNVIEQLHKYRGAILPNIININNNSNSSTSMKSVE
jgi:hypothetical protein